MNPQPDSLRERKKRETRERIRDAAVALADAKGIADTTVEEICAAADVSVRTFFNYYPTKNAAILGLPALIIPDEAREKFLAGSGALIDDIVTLITGIGLELPGKHKHGIVKRHPELASTLMEWGSRHRSDLISIVEQRTDPATARLAVGAVMISFGDAASEGGDISPETVDTEVHLALDRLSALLSARAPR
ncbi:TetR/AcrR family transcriptional regulator [Microbacterium mangrovi]|uniref:TetR/AcrR family transcriptional regulator n=1 Tax=Microbacterium mangrovi TaxID=1348253 RepID=UPI0006908237|nr:TetR/AcrR family transcriptional regulator [Microbacterium mangrovi]